MSFPLIVIGYLSPAVLLAPQFELLPLSWTGMTGVFLHARPARYGAISPTMSQHTFNTPSSSRLIGLRLDNYCWRSMCVYLHAELLTACKLVSGIFIQIYVFNPGLMSWTVSLDHPGNRSFCIQDLHRLELDFLFLFSLFTY